MTKQIKPILHSEIFHHSLSTFCIVEHLIILPFTIITCPNGVCRFKLFTTESHDQIKHGVANIQITKQVILEVKNLELTSASRQFVVSRGG